MVNRTSQTTQTWSPLYFLASLGAGGLTVTFFMFLMFWVPHPGQPVPVFEDIAAALANGALPLRAAVVLALLGIAGFAFVNLRLLVWNFMQFAAFRRTEAYQKLIRSNAETQLLAMPLALAMSVNAGFIVGLVFVPGLWGVVEYLFPAAMLGFALIALVALHRTGLFLGRVLGDGGGFDGAGTASFGHLLPAFALAMTAVGLSAPAGLSMQPAIVGVSLILSIMLGTIAALYALVAAFVAFAAMLRHGVDREGAPTVMVIVPLLTVLGIMAMRQQHGLHTVFGAQGGMADTLLLTTTILAVQLVFLALGLSVLKRQNYAQAFVLGARSSAGAYALICPGVALSVMLHFWINKGLVAAGLLAKFGIGYWALTSVALMAQVAMIALLFYLNRRHLVGGVMRAEPA
ncbi:MAG: hypothetical protein NXH74_10940 [Rhodobacteraceae bacterium]|nr:hypothetical protein [Paracoccaceae bacterium]